MKRPRSILLKTRLRRCLVVVLAFSWVAVFLAPPSTAQVAISETDITVADEDVLTMGHATPLYIRGTGFFDPVFRFVRLGDQALVNDNARGLTLTVLDARTHTEVGTSTNFDTWALASESDALAARLLAMTDTQIGILTSYDAFSNHLTQSLRTQARRLGLFKLAGVPAPGSEPTWQRKYAAIFYGSGAANHHAVEVLQPREGTAPHAIIATWLINDGFVGQGFPSGMVGQGPDPPCPDDSGNIYVDCGNGTVTDNRTGLVWLKDANCLGSEVDWYAAMGFVAGLYDSPAPGGIPDCGLSDGSSPGEWRLPSADEWAAMIDDAKGQGGDPDCVASPPTITNDSGLGCWVSGPSSFIDVVSDRYWSSTTLTSVGGDAVWAAYLNVGVVTFSQVKTSSSYVWPVRDGQ